MISVSSNMDYSATLVPLSAPSPKYHRSAHCIKGILPFLLLELTPGFGQSLEDSPICTHPLIKVINSPICAPARVGMLHEPKSDGGMRNKTHTNKQTYNIKQNASIGRAACSWWEHECLPKPGCLFYRSVQGKDSVKNQALTILDAR
jgi:hypothetical protein